MFTNQNNNPYHKYFMDLALLQAKINLGNTQENPSVGCVIVKNNSLISAGNTGINGTPHAEFKAIVCSQSSPKNSDLYVTLEPCSHYGKTPPCVKKIIKSKIKRVFFSVNDPDQRSFKKSIKLLKEKGIKTNVGINSSLVKDFYRSYFAQKKNKMPFLTLKIAVSKDFFSINKKKKWITNIYSRSRVHLMRATHNCILTSSQTVIKDNPLLDCRIKGLEHQSPTKIIIDKNLNTPINAKIIEKGTKNSTIIFYNKSNQKKINFFIKKKIKLVKSSLDLNNNLNLEEVLIKIKKLGFSRVFVECGESLSFNFLKNNLVNDLKIFISDYNLKKNGSGSIKKYFNAFLKNKKSKIEKVNLLGDKLISYRIK